MARILPLLVAFERVPLDVIWENRSQPGEITQEIRWLRGERGEGSGIRYWNGKIRIEN